MALLAPRWVGFDTPETLWLKKQGAEERGVGGVMVWAASYDPFPDQPLVRVRGEVGRGAGST